MTDPVRWGLRRDLHETTLDGDGSLQCDYHDASATIATDEPALFECIRILDPQLDGYRSDEHWRIDAVRCSECTVTEIEPPTLGYEEALVRVPLAVSNDVISIAAPNEAAVVVHGFSSAAEGTHPMEVDHQLQAATEPDEYGIGRWMRVRGVLESDPPDELRGHIERLIERSPEPPDVLPGEQS